MKSNQLILFVALLLACNVLYSQNTLSIGNTFELMNQFHPIAKQAGLKIDLSKASLLSTRGAFDPAFYIANDQKTFDGKNYFFYSNPELKIPTWYGIEIKGGLENNYGDKLSGEVKQGQDIRPAGLESKKGEVLAAAGTILNPGLIGLLAAAGHDSLEVVRAPKATIILLGDEIVLDGLPHDGLVRDALGPQLPGWLQRLGVEVIATEYISDELNLVVDAFAKAAKSSDIIFTTGGTADGPRDHVHAAIAELKGELIVDRVKVRPGHPMLLAHINNVPLVGLPGNPQSAIVALLTLGQPVIDALMGRKEVELNQIVTGDDIDVPEGFTRLVLGNVVDGWFEMGEYLGSAMLRGLAHSTGFAVAEKSMEEGEMVAWLP